MKGSAVAGKPGTSVGPVFAPSSSAPETTTAPSDGTTVDPRVLEQGAQARVVHADALG